MAPTAASHGRSHSLLLAQKLLSSKDGASPLTLVLDTLEQNAAPLLSEFASRAKVGPLATQPAVFPLLQLGTLEEADLYRLASVPQLQPLVGGPSVNISEFDVDLFL